MDKTQLQALSDYGLCQSCMMVSEGWNPATSASGACPNCGESGFGLEWPPEPAGLLLRQAFALEDPLPVADSESEPSAEATCEQEIPEPFGDGAGYELRKDARVLEEADLAAVRGFLVTTALDVMLEWVFKAAAESFDTDSLEVARFAEPRYEATLTTDERLDMLHRVAGIDLNDIANEQDQPRFAGWWKELRRCHGAFLHAHSMTAFDGVQDQALLDMAEAGVKVVAAMNNALW